MDDKRLKEIVLDYMEEIRIPKQIDNVIQASITRIQEESRFDESSDKSGKRWIKRFTYGIASIATIIIIFTITINTNDAFASTLSEIPILKDLVKIFMIKKDSNLKDAIEHNFIQDDNIINTEIEKKEEIEYKIESVIMEESRIVVTFSLKGIELGKQGDKFYDVRLDIYNEYGEEIANLLTSEIEDGLGLVQYSIKDYGRYESDEQFKLQITDNVIIKTKIRKTVYQEDGRENKEDIYSSEAKVKVDKSKFNKESIYYQINKTLTFGDSKIHFKMLKLTPTNTMLTYDITEGKGKTFYGIKGLTLTDGKEINVKSDDSWAGMGDTFVKNEYIPDKERQADGIIFFPSIYYKDFKELYLQGGTISMPEEKERTIEIDMTKNPIAQSRFYNFEKVGKNKIKVTQKDGTEVEPSSFEVEAILVSDIKKGDINYYNWTPENLSEELLTSPFQIRIRAFGMTDQLNCNINIKKVETDIQEKKINGYVFEMKDGHLVNWYQSDTEDKGEVINEDFNLTLDNWTFEFRDGILVNYYERAL